MIQEEYRFLAESYIEDLIRDGKAAGVAAAVINDKGETLYENFFGYRDKENKLPVDGDTIFGLASITKSFVSIGILQLAEQGLVDLDAPLQSYVPEYTGKNRKEKLTLKHLLTHSAGYYVLPRICVDMVAADMGIKEEETGDFSYYVPLQKEAARQVAEQFDRQAGDAISGVPGEFFSYCNDGYGIVSDVIRRKGDCDTFAEYLKKHILTPLGMDRSSCDFVAPAADGNAATLYQTVDGKEVSHRNYHDTAFCLNGAGGMKSTLTDMKKYMGMFLNRGMGLNGTRVLPEARIREMTSAKTAYGQHDTYGYGCIQRHFGKIQTIEHSGGLPGVSSYFQFSYDAGLAVVVLCNTTGASAGLMADALMRMALGEDPRPARKDYARIPWDEDFLAAASGEYASVGQYSDADGTHVVFGRGEDGQPTLTFNGKPQLFVTVGRHEGIVRTKHSDRFIRIQVRDGKPFAVLYGSEMFQKVN